MQYQVTRQFVSDLFVREFFNALEIGARTC